MDQYNKYHFNRYFLFLVPLCIYECKNMHPLSLPRRKIFFGNVAQLPHLVNVSIASCIYRDDLNKFVFRMAIKLIKKTYKIHFPSIEQSTSKMYHLLLILAVSASGSTQATLEQPSTVELVHVIHRHGDRTPDAGSIYPTNAFTNETFYWPYGFGQLTNQGKRTAYNLGLALRERYDSFLGNIWSINTIEARTTDYNRTKMTLELALAGLWPPKGVNVWNLYLDWQPIPYNYLPLSQDKEMFPTRACTTKFISEMLKVITSEEIGGYLESRYQETLEIIAENSGTSGLFGSLMVYFTLLVQEQLDLPLDNWTQAVYPEPLKSLVVDIYYIQTNTTSLRRMMAGYLLKKILSDTAQKINGTSPPGRKMFIYSGHEQNVAMILLSLEAFKLAEVPPYASHVLVELHRINEVWGIKLFYQDYHNPEPYALSIPGCDQFCPFDQFSALVEEIIPTSDENCSDG